MVIFYTGKGENEDFLLQRKGQSGDNCCLSGREPNANKEEQIKENRLGKERKDISSAHKKRQDKELTV